MPTFRGGVQDFFYLRKMQNLERVQIFIDGGNFYHLALKKLNINSLDFSFENFANFLADGRKIIDLGKRFYIGTIREKEGDLQSKKNMSEQTKLFAKLDKTNWQRKTSKLRTRLEKVKIDQRTIGYKELHEKGISSIKFHRMREKGIDVKIAVDMIIGAMDDKYDTAILVSSDTDLVPAVNTIINRFNKKVEYIGFSIFDSQNKRNTIKPSQALISRSSISRVLVKNDIVKFIK